MCSSQFGYYFRLSLVNIMITSIFNQFGYYFRLSLVNIYYNSLSFSIFTFLFYQYLDRAIILTDLLSIINAITIANDITEYIATNIISLFLLNYFIIII